MGYFLSRMTGIPMVYTGHLTYGSGIFSRLLSGRLAIAVTQSVREDIDKHSHFENISVVPNSANFMLEDDGCATGEYVLCVGRLEPIKNHGNLLRAWSIVTEDFCDAQLVVVGEGSLDSDLKRLASELHIERNVKFVGYHTDIEHFIDGARFMVLTSFKEGQGIVTIEGAGRKKASLLTDVDGSRDCVPPNARLPNLIDPNSVSDIADAL
jgi:glycosyltransferase involved in cell wall biosynthesis